MGLWGKNGFGEKREMGLWGKEGFEREKDIGGGHGRGKQELISEEKEERVKDIEMRFWLCTVDIFNIKSGVLHPIRTFNLISFLLLKFELVCHVNHF